MNDLLKFSGEQTQAGLPFTPTQWIAGAHQNATKVKYDGIDHGRLDSILEI